MYLFIYLFIFFFSRKYPCLKVQTRSPSHFYQFVDSHKQYVLIQKLYILSSAGPIMGCTGPFVGLRSSFQQTHDIRTHDLGSSLVRKTGARGIEPRTLL